MVELKTAEQVIYFMRANVSLSRYDERFIDSLQLIKQVTTNQVELFYKLILKYRRQFAKHDIEVEPLIMLPWVMPVIESAKQYTDGHVVIENDMLYFRCPYNRNFITKFRESSSNPFIWNKETRQYEAKYGQHTLKFLIEATINHFPCIHYCPETITLLESVHPYSTSKFWDPTLLRINGRLYVVASNPYLDEAIKDIELNTDVATLAKLASYGIKIDNSLYDTNDPYMRFVTDSNPIVEVSDAINMIAWLQEINCDMVYFGSSTANPLKKKFMTDLSLCGIEYRDISMFSTIDLMEESTFPVLIQFIKSLNVPLPRSTAKVIRIINSQPIDIK